MLLGRAVPQREEHLPGLWLADVALSGAVLPPAPGAELPRQPLGEEAHRDRRERGGAIAECGTRRLRRAAAGSTGAAAAAAAAGVSPAEQQHPVLLRRLGHVLALDALHQHGHPGGVDDGSVALGVAGHAVFTVSDAGHVAVLRLRLPVRLGADNCHGGEWDRMRHVLHGCQRARPFSAALRDTLSHVAAKQHTHGLVLGRCHRRAFCRAQQRCRRPYLGAGARALSEPCSRRSRSTTDAAGSGADLGAALGAALPAAEQLGRRDRHLGLHRAALRATPGPGIGFLRVAEHGLQQPCCRHLQALCFLPHRRLLEWSQLPVLSPLRF
mmetsp:Transcript_10186/g.26224  ORF Transcript_10186/g.26224 Transcript_10186/m.26224 type:complete len:326 (-) Transcript_10186:413-1390(-)